MELLAPAGSRQALTAAVQSGADAVYLGGPQFGARYSAENFTIEEMKTWVDYCHLYGVDVHVTVNTLACKVISGTVFLIISTAPIS